jgi:Mg2+/Co2+ transporter CorC
MEKMTEILKTIKEPGFDGGVSIKYAAYLNFDVETLIVMIEDYNKSYNTTFTLQDVDSITDKYGELYLHCGEHDIHINVYTELNYDAKFGTLQTFGGES